MVSVRWVRLRPRFLGRKRKASLGKKKEEKGRKRKEKGKQACLHQQQSAGHGALVVTSFLGGLICAQHSRDLDYQVLPLQNCSGFVRFASLLRHLRRSFFETQRRALYPVVLTCHGTSPTNTTQSSNPPLGKRLRLWVPMLVLSVLLGLLFLFFLYQFHQLAKDSWFHRTHADRDDSHA